MPVIDGIGRSGETRRKQESLRRFLGQHIAVVRNVWRKYSWSTPCYYFVDLNYGQGQVEIDGNYIDGSPIIFLNVSEAMGVDRYGYFIDENLESVKTLEKRIGANSEYHSILHGDHNEVIKSGAVFIPEKKTLGLIYHDPNGVPSWDLIAHCAEQFRRVDILIRVAACSIKRGGTTRLYECLPKIDKRFWMVQHPHPSDQWQWTFLFGSNTDCIREMRSDGWRYTNTYEGRMILQRLNYTTNELRSLWQKDLFDEDDAA